jgi:hypothetical protein
MGRAFPWVGAAAAAAMVATFAAPAQARGTDVDGDGIPNRWERTHGMNPQRAADALRDFDVDRLTNRAEYRLRIRIRDEDSDNDGHDDGDEVRDGLRSTDVDDRDTDGDGRLDGDEDADRDGVDNEDEDDAREACALDDDDRDRDSVDDEDENELALQVRDGDSDDDGVSDGEEDDDADGESNEDEDDSAGDDCDGDRDGDGEDDEDERDLIGTIDSFDGAVLTVNLTGGGQVVGRVSSDTEVDFEDQAESNEDDGEDATVDDLRPGVEVAELEYDDKTGDLEEVEIYQQLA